MLRVLSRAGLLTGTRRCLEDVPEKNIHSTRTIHAARMRALPITLVAITSVAAQCDRWAAAGECTRNPDYMRVRCADECAQAANAAPPPSPAPSPLPVYTKSACAAWAAAGECAHNRNFMSQSCSTACQCESWANAGECTRNSAFMLEGCADACTRSPPPPPPPPPAVESECVKWAAVGECEANAAFMMHSCSAACEEATRQRPCSMRVCAGLAEHACDADSMPVAAAASPTAPAPWHTLPQLTNTPAPIAVINEAEVPARLLWVDALGVEHAFGVVMPGARLQQPSFLGHRWRSREMLSDHEAPDSGRLLLDWYANTLFARASCRCNASDEVASRQRTSLHASFGVDAANASSGASDCD